MMDARKAFEDLAKSDVFSKSELREFQPKGVCQTVVVQGLSYTI